MIEHDGSLDQASVNDLINARALTCAMDGLPLALDQAGAYILETTCSLSNYLNLYQEHHAALLKRRGKLFVGHPASVTTTFSLAFKTIEQRNRHAINLLSFCAFLHPDAIPEKI